MTKSKLSIQDICMTGLFAAIISVMSQISIPLPFGVPLTMQTFAVVLAAIVLGAGKGTAATLIYLLLGAAGAPVLANFAGGLQFFIGPTGGFLLSFPVMSYAAGKGMEKRFAGKGVLAAGIAAGFLINYICGTAFFCYVMDSSIITGIMSCVLPFLPADIIKGVLAGTLGLKVRERLVKAV